MIAPTPNERPILQYALLALTSTLVQRCKGMSNRCPKSRDKHLLMDHQTTLRHRPRSSFQTERTPETHS